MRSRIIAAVTLILMATATPGSAQDSSSCDRWREERAAFDACVRALLAEEPPGSRRARILSAREECRERFRPADAPPGPYVPPWWRCLPVFLL